MTEKKNREKHWSDPSRYKSYTDQTKFNRIDQEKKAKFRNIRSAQNRAKKVSSNKKKQSDFIKQRRIQEGQARAKRAMAKKKKDAAFNKKRDSKVRTGQGIVDRIRQNRKRHKRELAEAKQRRKNKQTREKDKKRRARMDRKAIPKKRRIGGFLLKHAKASAKKRRK